jgi:hypothetical protein
MINCPYWKDNKCNRKVDPEINLQHRDEIKEVCLYYISRLKEWGFTVPDDQTIALKTVWGMMENLVRYGIPKKPKGNINENYTPPDKMKKIIDSINKPSNPIAALIDAVRHQSERL